VEIYTEFTNLLGIDAISKATKYPDRLKEVGSVRAELSIWALVLKEDKKAQRKGTREIATTIIITIYPIVL
jgi:hypothetical protein